MDPICVARLVNAAVTLSVPNGGSARGYHELRTSLTVAAESVG